MLKETPTDDAVVMEALVSTTPMVLAAVRDTVIVLPAAISTRPVVRVENTTLTVEAVVNDTATVEAVVMDALVRTTPIVLSAVNETVMVLPAAISTRPVVRVEKLTAMVDAVVIMTVEPETLDVPVTVSVAVDLTRMAETVETIAVELPEIVAASVEAATSATVVFP